MTPIYVRMYAKVYYVEGHEPDVSLTSDLHLRLPNGKRFYIGAVPRGQSGRKVTCGPVIPGPWAYAPGAAVVIDNNPERRKAEYDTDILVDEGTLLSIDRVVYRVEIERREFINLIEVKE